MKLLLSIISLTLLCNSPNIMSANPPTQEIPPTQEVPSPEPQPMPPSESPQPDSGNGQDNPEEIDDNFTDDFALESCTFQNTGKTQFLDLQPGRMLRFQSGNERLELSVLEEVREVQLPELEPVSTRILEEKKFEGDRLSEVTRKFLALCQGTNDVYMFGKEVDKHDEDGNVTHEGEWIAGSGSNKPGLYLPGTFLLGSRYYQEVAPDVSLTRVEHTDMGLEVETPAGKFTDCAEVTESSPENQDSKHIKVFCPDVGLVKIDKFLLQEMPTGGEESPTPEQPAPEQPAPEQPAPEQPAPEQAAQFLRRLLSGF